MVKLGFKLQNLSRYQQQTGYVLALALLISFMLTAIGISLATVAASKYSKTKRDISVSTANYVAEAGISATLARLYDDTSMTGTGYGPEVTFFNGVESGRATYSVKVDPGPSPSSRYISSTGKFFAISSATTPTSTQYVRVVANLNTSSSSYSIFAGPGGIELGSGAKLQSYSIYSGGKLTLQGNSTQIGDPLNTSKIDVANIGCTESGASSRFPYPCAYSDKPLLLNNNLIYGQVCANAQTDSTNINTTNGQSYGLIPSCSPLRSLINTVNRTELLQGTPSTFPASEANCNNIQKTPLTGTYTGNVTISNCLYGFPLLTYIRGDLTINGSVAQSSDATLTQGSLVLVTGKITINGSAAGVNASNANVRFISFNSSDSTGCSQQINCSSFPETTSGWATRQASLGVDGVNLSNNSNLFGAEITSYFGNIAVTGSAGSSINVHSVAGQKLTIASGVTLVSASSKSVSDLVQKRWVVTNYTRTFAP